MGQTLKKSRIAWIDVMKALLIIIVVIGHANSPFVVYIYLFHMSAFFILSGYTFKGQNQSIIKFIKQKIIHLLIPVYIINICFLLLYEVIEKMGFYLLFKPDNPSPFQDKLTALFKWYHTPDFGGATWFILVLFQAELIFRLLYVFSDITGRIEAVWIGSVILGGISYGLKLHNTTTLPYMLDLGFMAVFYMGIGSFLAHSNVKKYIIRYKMMLVPIAVLLTYYFGHIYFYGRLPMNWPSRTFYNIALQVTAAFGQLI